MRSVTPSINPTWSCLFGGICGQMAKSTISMRSQTSIWNISQSITSRIHWQYIHVPGVIVFTLTHILILMLLFFIPLWLAHSCAQVSVQLMVWLCLSVPSDRSLQYSALHTGLAYAWLTSKSNTNLTQRETLTPLVLYAHKPSSSGTSGALTNMNAGRKRFLMMQRKKGGSERLVETGTAGPGADLSPTLWHFSQPPQDQKTWHNRDDAGVVSSFLLVFISQESTWPWRY